MDLSLSESNDFQCVRCGNCCRGGGYVRLLPEEPALIAAYLDLTEDYFAAEYTFLTVDRRNLSIKERENGDCIFLNDKGACEIEEVKPKQCRDFPHKWRYPDYEKECAAVTKKEFQENIDES
jgi:Fe-S-cluster containining protein